MLGHPAAGSAIGSSLGAALSKWLGTGDYTVSANSLVTRAASGIPMMHKTSQSVVIRHREFIAQIPSSETFVVQQTFDINPGNSTLFPWLSQIAGRFQEYKIRGLVYHYIPTSGQYSTDGTALGSVMIQTSYRANEDPPATKIEMLNEYWANEVVPCETMCHPIECDPRENPFQIHYVKAAGIATSEPLLYDMGTTWVATSGCPNTGQILGDLWVTYEIELKKPIVASSLVAEGAYASRFLTPGSTAFFDGTEQIIKAGLNLSFSGRTVTLNAGEHGRYVLYAIIRSGGGLIGSASTSWGFSTAPTLVNCTAYNIYGDRAYIGCVNTATDVNSGALFYTCCVDKPASETIATITLPNAAWTSGTTDFLAFEMYYISY